jgi:uncharacterized PurR-regulated membrane protein YhhQ (DUF165 family)
VELKTVKIALALAGYAASIYLANWLVSRYGLVPAGFGPLVLTVPAGTYAAGLALALRVLLQDFGGRRLVIIGISLGIVLSAVFAKPSIAVASAAGFACGELLDWKVYSRLKGRDWSLAVFTAGLFGSLVDTLIFLSIAGFPLTARTVGGQVLTKAVFVSGAFIGTRHAVCALIRRRRVATA